MSGTGTNSLFASGTNDTISAQGTNGTLFGGPGAATFQIASTATGKRVRRTGRTLGH